MNTSPADNSPNSRNNVPRIVSSLKIGLTLDRILLHDYDYSCPDTYRTRNPVVWVVLGSDKSPNDPSWPICHVPAHSYEWHPRIRHQKHRDVRFVLHMRTSASRDRVPWCVLTSVSHNWPCCRPLDCPGWSQSDAIVCSSQFCCGSDCRSAAPDIDWSDANSSQPRHSTDRAPMDRSPRRWHSRVRHRGERVSAADLANSLDGQYNRVSVYAQAVAPGNRRDLNVADRVVSDHVVSYCKRVRSQWK